MITLRWNKSGRKQYRLITESATKIRIRKTLFDITLYADNVVVKLSPQFYNMLLEMGCI